MLTLPNAIKWLKTTGLAAIGGGIAGIVSALMDPEKYVFPATSAAAACGSGFLWGWA